MKEASEVTALVFDHGLFIPVARRLAKKFKRVLYTTPWAKGFTTINDCVIGDGFGDIERVDDFWPMKKEIDMFVFPDIQHAGLQLELEAQGFPVWGSRNGDSLEIYRQKFHRILGELGLDVPKFEPVLGLDRLREHLRDKEDKYIKISKHRGTLETTHWRNWDLDEGTLDYWAVKLGPAKNKVTFYVFDAIDTPLEIGGDTYNIRGQWPSLMLHGDERKDRGYLGAVTARADMPEQVQEILSAFGPELGKYGYINQWSMEVRVKDEHSFFIDPCCRGGLPSTGAQLMVWENWPEIVLAGAHGELVEPEAQAMFAAECVLTMKTAHAAGASLWGKTRIREELAEWVKFGGCCEIDGAICFPPDDSHGEEVGWLIATGDTIRETIQTMQERAKLLPDGLTAGVDSLGELLTEIRQAEAEGIAFTPQRVPGPEILLSENGA
jgi:hypothetical protein